MLSRLLHRKSTPVVDPTPPTLHQQAHAAANAIKGRIEPKQIMAWADVDFAVDVLQRVGRKENGQALTGAVLNRLGFDNGNTSYIEPFVEAAYKNNHPEKAFLGKLYVDFVATAKASEERHKHAEMLVYKLIDDRFYSSSEFPVHSLSLLGRQGVAVPENIQDHLLYRALASNTSIDQIKSTLESLKLDPNGIKDSQQRTLLHSLMAGNQHGDTKAFEHVLDRAKKLGMTPSLDIFGRSPDDFGTAKTRLMYAQYFEARTQEPLSALATYLQTTLHDFGGLGSVGSRNQGVYLKTSDPLNSTPKSTMFEHVLKSNDMTVISEFQRLIEPATRQHMDIEGSFPYVFIENYVCSPDAKPEVANQVFDLLQEKSPKDLSTALGFFLMRSDAYYKNYEVDVSHLAQYTPAIENIMEYQRNMGLGDLLHLEAAKLDIIAPQAEVAGLSMSM